MTARAAALAALAAGALWAPAGAAATQLTVDQACYAEKAGRITVGGSGFLPNSTATVALPGITTTAATDAAGAFTTTLPTPPTTLRYPGAQQLMLTATDPAGASAAAPVNVAKMGVDAVPSTSRPHARVTWYLAGFPGAKPIYGHWRIRGRTRADRRMGVPEGPCGVLQVRARQIEARRVLFGIWLVQFDRNRRFDKRATPRATIQIRVARAFS